MVYVPRWFGGFSQNSEGTPRRMWAAKEAGAPEELEVADALMTCFIPARGRHARGLVLRSKKGHLGQVRAKSAAAVPSIACKSHVPQYAPS